MSLLSHGFIGKADFFLIVQLIQIVNLCQEKFKINKKAFQENAY